MSLMMWRYMQHHGAGAPDAYAVGGFEPEFVADFSGTLNSGTEYYRSGGSDTTFSSVFTHSGLVLPATMTDSDGVLKWAPHNLLTNSNDFSDNAKWSHATSNMTRTTGQTDSDGGTTATRLSCTANGDCKILATPNITLTAVNHAYEVDAKYISGNGFLFIFWNGIGGGWFNLSTGATAATSGIISSSIVSLGNSYYRCRIVFNATAATTSNAVIELADASGSSTADSGDTIDVCNARVYRATLSMVNNPDRGDSYVPTTTAARFLPRRNNYIYNGTSWEKAGILIEPAAATNLITQSGNYTLSPWAVTGSIIYNTTTFVATSSATGAYSRFKPVLADNTTYTFSFEVKAGTLSWVYVYIRNQVSSNSTAYFNMSTGSFGTTTGTATWRATDVGNGFYRISGTFDSGASGTAEFVQVQYASADGSTSISVNDTILVRYFQLEVGSVPTSYIPTAGSTVTRAAETLTVAGVNLPNSTSSMSYHAKGRISFTDDGDVHYIFSRGTSGASNTIDLSMAIRTDSTWQGSAAFRQCDGAFNIDLVSEGPTVGSYDGGGVSVPFNMAMRNTSSAINGAAEGVKLTANTTPTSLGDFSGLSCNFGVEPGNITSNMAMSLAMFRAWGTDIGETGIEEAST